MKREKQEEKEISRPGSWIDIYSMQDGQRRYRVEHAGRHRKRTKAKSNDKEGRGWMDQGCVGSRTRNMARERGGGRGRGDKHRQRSIMAGAMAQHALGRTNNRS